LLKHDEKDVVRIVKPEKYMEILVDDSIIKDKITYDEFPTLVYVGRSFSLNDNVFYGIKATHPLYQRVHINDFDDCDLVCRLVYYIRYCLKEEYILRILKTNKNDKVDFEDEKRYLNSFYKIGGITY
jgi:hypothetical protein